MKTYSMPIDLNERSIISCVGQMILRIAQRKPIWQPAIAQGMALQIEIGGEFFKHATSSTVEKAMRLASFFPVVRA